MNNKIQTYIAELVGSHDCVIVPGFGAFISQPTSADIHPITNKFSPPGRTIGFNGQIKINDGLLASFICTAEDVTFQEANTLIEEFVKHFNNNIHLFKSFEIKEVGRFFYNLEGKLEFEPDYHHDFSSDSFGLTEFVFKPIERNTFDMNQPSQHRNSKTASSKTSVKKNKEETDEESNSSSAFGKILLVAMPFLVLIGAFFVYNKQKDVSLGGINFTETLGLKKHEVVADTAMAPDSVAIAETIVQNTEVVEEQP
ncbi:MAG: SPOR domain-containing protein, partial [Cytophagales bacterium]|nr:SPOR domain-containing protein [Cytophaga sp.]